jgi:hypothetical protein
MGALGVGFGQELCGGSWWWAAVSLCAVLAVSTVHVVHADPMARSTAAATSFLSNLKQIVSAGEVKSREDFNALLMNDYRVADPNYDEHWCVCAFRPGPCHQYTALCPQYSTLLYCTVLYNSAWQIQLLTNHGLSLF